MYKINNKIWIDWYKKHVVKMEETQSLKLFVYNKNL